MKTWGKFQVAEFFIFLIGWTLIMLAGADFPPPEGFKYLVLLIFILDILQQFYLKWLCPRIKHQKTFLLNMISFMFAGLVLAGTIYIWSGEFHPESNIWIAIITVVSVIYGIFFWSVNWLIATKIQAYNKL